ncbi:MAG: hypothetical protein ACTSRI_14230 [Promethearchaeota archaeon]
MSSGIVKKKHLDNLETEEEDSELFFVISKFVVSFLNVLKKKHPMDNYDEDENIFLKEENESEFKNILKQEFADAIKEFSKTIKK